MPSPLNWILLFTSNLPNSSFVRSSAPWFLQAPWPTTSVGTLWTSPSSWQSRFLCCLWRPPLSRSGSFPCLGPTSSQLSMLPKVQVSPRIQESDLYVFKNHARKTSRCLLQELKVGPPSSKKLLLSALSWMVALPPPVSSLLFSTNLSTMSPRSSSKGAALLSFRHPQTLLLHLLSLQLSPQASSLNLPILVLGIFSWRKAISPANIFFSTIFQPPLLSTILQECGDDCFCGGHAADAAVPR